MSLRVFIVISVLFCLLSGIVGAEPTNEVTVIQIEGSDNVIYVQTVEHVVAEKNDDLSALKAVGIVFLIVVSLVIFSITLSRLEDDSFDDL